VADTSPSRPDPGYGPPPGSSSDAPWAPAIPADQVRGTIDGRVGGAVVARDDPAFQPPSDPLKQSGTKARTALVYRDVPLVTIQNSWTPVQIVGALRSHMTGIFETSGQLVDSMLGDDRVTATLGSRISGLFGAEVRHKPATNKRVAGSQAAQECADAWAEWWPKFADGFALPEMHAYGIFMGFMPGQLIWDTTDTVWGPYLRPWHPRYTYYNWDIRKYIAISLDGQLPIFPGDGKWVLHAPYGEYRGWIRGAVRACAEPWAIRHYAIRDWAGFSEIHGFPIRKAIVPASSDPNERNLFQAQIAALGSNTSILVPEGIDAKAGGTRYDLELVEATDTAWESFPGLRDHCDMAIVLAIMFQNLTTEVKGGAFAATESHMDIRQGGIRNDNFAWKSTLYNQVIRPFAFLNFGDADLAPTSDWDVRARADYDANAKQFQAFGTAVEVLARGGVKFANTDALIRFARETLGLAKLPSFTIGDPVAASGGGGGGFGK
jgi:phage gp29-like protein